MTFTKSTADFLLIEQSFRCGNSYLENPDQCVTLFFQKSKEKQVPLSLSGE